MYQLEVHFSLWKLFMNSLKMLVFISELSEKKNNSMNKNMIQPSSIMLLSPEWNRL